MTPEIQMALAGVLAAAGGALALVIGAIGRRIAAAIEGRAVVEREKIEVSVIEAGIKRAEAIAESAISEATEGEPSDEGGTIAAVADYLQSSVGETIAKRGGSVPSMAAAIALGVIARAAKR